MLLLNPTDTPMQHPAGIRAPEINGGQETSFPPRNFMFAPGEMQEVPDEAGTVLLDHLGRRGLVQITMHANPKTHAAHLEEARLAGRRQWFLWLNRQVQTHKGLVEEMRAKGLSPLHPNPDVLAAYRLWRDLRSSPEFSDPIMADASVPAMTPQESADLQGDPVMLRDAQREAARAAELDA
jgi:hypothetical protein